MHHVSVAAFQDLARRFGRAAGARRRRRHARARVGRLLATDPGGAWVAERDGESSAAALGDRPRGRLGPVAARRAAGRAVQRRRPRAAGPGVRLRRRRARPDRAGLARPAALRSYARLGLDLHPALRGARRPAAASRRRPRSGAGTPADLPLTDAVDRAVRGAAHGDDIAAMLEAGGELLVLARARLRGRPRRRGAPARRPRRGRRGDAAARLPGAPPARREASVEWITSAQGWAIAPCLDAGLELRFDVGAVFLAGDVGPFAPYLPSGAYLVSASNNVVRMAKEPRSLTGKVVAITGGGRGIGRAIAAGAGARGRARRRRRPRPRVGRADRRRARGERARRSRSTSPTTPASRRSSTRSSSALGPLDVLVNNAGIMPRHAAGRGEPGEHRAPARHQPARGHPRHAGGDAPDGPARHRPHRQHRLDRRPQRVPAPRHLLRDQARRRRALGGGARRSCAAPASRSPWSCRALVRTELTDRPRRRARREVSRRRRTSPRRSSRALKAPRFDVFVPRSTGRCRARSAAAAPRARGAGRR